MSRLDIYGDLLSLGHPIVTTNEAATRLKTSASNASRVLRSMEDAGLVRRLRPGLWTLDRNLNPFAAASYLTAPYPAYVSFWSALARHGMIEQIPRQISVASLGRTRRITTPLGTYSIHHLIPELFDGYRPSDTDGHLATPEKALFDTVYVRAARATRVYFPELSLPPDFDKAQLRAWTNQVPTQRLRTLVSRGLAKAFKQAA